MTRRSNESADLRTVVWDMAGPSLRDALIEMSAWVVSRGYDLNARSKAALEAAGVPYGSPEYVVRKSELLGGLDVDIGFRESQASVQRRVYAEIDELVRLSVFSKARADRIKGALTLDVIAAHILGGQSMSDMIKAHNDLFDPDGFTPRTFPLSPDPTTEPASQTRPKGKRVRRRRS